MKKQLRTLAAVLAAASLCTALAACGDSSTPSETTADSVIPPNWNKLPVS